MTKSTSKPKKKDYVRHINLKDVMNFDRKLGLWIIMSYANMK